MSETKRFTAAKSGSMLAKVVWDMDGGWLRYSDHKAEVQRLRGELDAERDQARAEIERLTAERHQLRGDVEALTAERDAAQAEVERLTVRLEHAQARIVPPLPHADESAQQVQDKMDAYITSLTTELTETREKLAHVQTQYDEFARVTAKTIGQHQRERDEARQQVYRLQQACGDTGASGQGMRDASHPSDETIWWKAFNSFLRDDSLTIEEVADQAQAALTIYRARWPR